MERRAELVSGLGACILGLICVLMEAQALANPVGNPTISWLLGTGIYSGIGNAIANTQQALLPMAVVLAVLALGAYVHVVHGNVAGLVLLISSSAIVIVSSGFIVFTPPYVAILFVPAPLVVFTAVLAGAASVCGLSSLEPGKPHLPHISLRVGSSRHTRSREAL